MFGAELPNVVSGFGVGVVVGLTGVGGGALMTPILVLVFGMAPATAVGTDLWFAAITKMAGGAMLHAKGRVDWHVLKLLCLGSLPAAVVTLLGPQLVGAHHVKHGLILASLGAVLVLTAGAMLFKQQAHALGRAMRINAAERFKSLQPALTVAAGAVRVLRPLIAAMLAIVGAKLLGS